VNYGRTLVAASVLLVAAATHPAVAQMTWTEAPASNPQSWTFALTPYFWLATVRADLNFSTRRGGTVTDNIEAGVNDYISHLNFAGMAGAEARYDRFSVMTDVVFTSLSFTTENSHFSRLNLPTGPLDIPRQTQLGTGTRMNAGIWGLAGAYTVFHQDSVNVDVLGGFRFLGIGSQLNYGLTSDITLPDRSVALARTGSLSLGADYVDVIFGVRGRFNIPDSRWFVPFYLDIGTAGIPLTWQAYTGIGYHTSVADLSLGYRYLDFQQHGNKTIHNLSLGGAILAASFHF